jgi:hypothetical protein
MFKKLKITCDQATTICDKSQYGEASFSEIVLLKLHFLKCKLCSLYTKQNTFLSKIYQKTAINCKKQDHCFSKEEKAALKYQLENKKA